MSENESALFEQQYDALRSSGGMVALPDWSSVSLTGADRQQFLHNFCTNDIKWLLPGTNCEEYITNVKGKIVAHVLATCRDEELVLLGAPQQGQRLVEHLDRYIIREDVRLLDTTAERSYLLVAGDDTARARCDRIARIADNSQLIQSLANAPATIAGKPVQIIDWPLIGSEFKCLIELRFDDSPVIVNHLVKQGFVECGPQAWTAARIESGMPLFGMDFDEQNLPQEVGRDAQAISFTKGCYLGQETVARIDALGHVNQRLAGVWFFGEKVPAAGTALVLGDASVGRVTSAAFSPRLNAPLALAMVRREANAPGTSLESTVGACEVVTLPLESRGG